MVGVDPAAVREIEALPQLRHPAPHLRPGDLLEPTLNQQLTPFRAYLTGDDPRRLEADHARLRELQHPLYRLTTT
ncbi:MULTISPECIES: hypothetical protein [unclassified Streptomyces]|uniref:hypothetical protein n=1 Tax=unclassified Streptomyces TaxID=2593676 RepID=UPI002E1894BD|nr:MULTISPECIES: hypothetical protein [unclassified Streptomyces]